MTYNCNGSGFDATIDDIVHAAREFGRRMREMGRDMAHEAGAYGFDSCFERAFDRGPGAQRSRGRFYFYPPVNIYNSRDGSLVLEFDLSGIDQDEVKIEFQGDYLILSAKAAGRETEAEEGSYYRHSFRPRDIERQKYYVPAADYVQAQAKASFKNGALRVVVPPKEDEKEGIKVTIVKESD